MRLIVIGSGSKENGYILQATTGEVLILEAGCHLSKIEAILDCEFSQVVGCLTSHCHGDHFAHAKSYLNAGIHVYMNDWSMEKSNMKSHRAHIMTSGQQFKIGNFTIKPLEVEHDVPCLAFLIDHPECGRTFFLTDSSFCRWNLSKAKIVNWMVECNYEKDKLQANFDSGLTPKNVYDRVIFGHFGLHNCIEFFKANDLSHTKRIITLHLSKDNGNAKLFKSKLAAVTGKPIMVATAGLIVEPFGVNIF